VRLREGDTLGVLAAETGVAWSEIVKANGGSAANRATIDAWIESVDGQKTGAVDDQGRPWWAFTPGVTVLWLPQGSRVCECDCEPAASSSSPLGIIGAAVAAYLILGD
jgi:hypothetical protein